MKIIGVMVGLGVVVLVVVGYDLLMKLAKKQSKQVEEKYPWSRDNKDKSMHEIIAEVQRQIFEQEDQLVESIKTKINEPNESNSKQSKKTKSK